MKQFNKKNLGIILTLCLMLYAPLIFAQKMSAGSGSWNIATNWSPTGVPASGEHVTILPGHTISIFGTSVCNNLTIDAGGTLLLGGNNDKLTVEGNTSIRGMMSDALNDIAGNGIQFNGTLTVDSGGTIRTMGLGNFIFSFRGNIINSGTFDLTSGSTIYSFDVNPITITPNTLMRFNAFNSGAGNVNTNVTIADGNGNVELFANGVAGVAVATAKTLVNINGGTGVLITNSLSGAGTFLNSSLAVLDYRAGDITIANFTATASPNKVMYTATGPQNIRSTVYHDLEIVGSGTKTMMGNTTINGSLFITSPAALNTSTNTVTFAGTNNSTISVSSPITFYDLVINKSNTFNSIVTNNSITVNNTLTLTQGKCYLGNFNLTMTNTTPANQLLPALPTNASYIVTDGAGKLIRQNLGIAFYQFPVGDPTNMYKVGLELQTGSGVGTASVAFAPENPITSPAPPAGAYDFGAGKWRIQSGWNNTAPLFYAPGTANNIADIHRDMTGWVKIGGSFNAGNYATNALNMASESIFAIFAVLNTPKAFTATNVTPAGFTANWSTESGVDGYKIDVSTAVDFSSFVAGYNNTDVGNVILRNITGLPANTIYYYRVRAYKTAPAVTTPNSNIKMTSTFLPAGGGRALQAVSGIINAGNPTSLYNTYFSVEFWIQAPPNVSTGIKPIISKWQASEVGWYLEYDADNRKILATIHDGSTPNTIETGDGSVTPGAWHHVAFTLNSAKELKLFLNGVLLSSTTGSISDITTTADIIINANTPIDEVRIWGNTDIAFGGVTTHIRDFMCKKINNTHNYFANLVAYFPMNEGTQATTTKYVENKAPNATFDATYTTGIATTISQAPIGDMSVNLYGSPIPSSGVNVTLTDTDIFKITNITGSPTGIHVYKVKDVPNHIVPPTNYTSSGGGILDSRYWGVFVVGGSTPKFDVAYSYATNNQVTKPNALRFGYRSNLNGLLWNPYGGITNGITKNISRRGASAGEFVLAQRNSIISNALNGGTVLDLNGTTKTATSGNPLVGDDFTIEFWLNMPTNTPQNGTKWVEGRRIITFESAVNKNDFGISLLGNASVNYFAFGTRDGASTAYTLTSTSTALADKWQHIAVTRSKTTGLIQIFINGKLDASLANANMGTLNGGINMILSKDLIGTNTWQGYIDELRIWKSVLTADDIKDYMNLRANDTHPSYANLAAYYRFDENIGTLCEDLQVGDDMTLSTTGMFTSASQALGDGYAKRKNTVTDFTVDGNGDSLLSFWGTGTPEVDITFPGTTGTYPAGELVATRVSAAPNNYPASSGSAVLNGTTVPYSGVTSFMNCYWVIRNYGVQPFDKLKSIKFEIPSGNSLGAAVPSDLLLFKRPTNSVNVTDWKLVGVGGAFGSINFLAGGPTDIEDFSEFIIGTGSAPLGVSLTNFEGKRLDETSTRLAWTTANEQQNRGFEIQRSTDSQNFKQIGFLDGSGNSQLPKSYQFIDTEAKGSYYYRLLQVDANGNSTYSPILYLKAEVGKEDIVLYPNPVSQELKIALSGAVNGVMRAEVFEVQGKLVWEGKGNLKELENSLNSKLQGWKDGTYLFRLYAPEKVLESKFIKRK